MKKYKPISCQLYDQLEELAVRKTQSSIMYMDLDQEKMIEATIVDFKTFEKEEFVILNNGLEIRLDMLLKVNEIIPAKGC